MRFLCHFTDSYSAHRQNRLDSGRHGFPVPFRFPSGAQVARPSAKHRRVERREELPVQGLGRCRKISAVDDHTDVQ